MTTADTQGRRKYPRVDFQTKISLILGDEEHDVSGSSKNLSMTGLFVETTAKAAPGARCQVRVILSGMVDGLALMIHAKVVRVSSEGLGIVFDTMDLESYTHLKNIIQYNSATED